MNPTDDFMELLQTSLKGVGLDIEKQAEEIRAYAASQLEALAMAAGEPGYARAVLAARDNVLLKAGINVAKVVAASEQRVVGIVQGALFLAARFIAGGAV